MQQTIKPILKYPGAKWSSAEWVVRHLPKTKHYLEPYCGSAAVYFNLTWKPEHVVLNDLSGEIVNLFRVLRTDGDRLAALVDMTPWAREEYELSFMACDDALERARRFIVQTWQMHGTRTHDAAKNQGWRTVGHQGQATTTDLWRKLPERLLSSIRHLQRAEIEHCPAGDLIRRYAGNNVLIYADPPYVRETRSHDIYEHEMTDADHALLLDALAAHPGPVVLSGYHCALYDTRLAHWHTREKQAQAEKGNTRTEVLWLNQVCIDRLGYGPMFEERL
jgi:DNA adenine methylase